MCVCGGGGGKLFTTKKYGEIHQAELNYPGKLKMEAIYSILLGKRQVCIYGSIRVVRYDYIWLWACHDTNLKEPGKLLLKDWVRGLKRV